MDDEKSNNIGSDDSNKEEVIEELFNDESEEEEIMEDAIDGEYDDSFSNGPYRQNQDQSVIDKLREIRNNAQNNLNNNRRKKDEDIDDRSGRKNKKDKKEGGGTDGDSSKKDGSDGKKDKGSKKDGADGAKEAGKDAAKDAGKDAAKEAGKEAAKDAAKDAAKEEAKKKAKQEVAEKAAEKAAQGKLMAIKLAILKYVAIAFLIIEAILFVIVLLVVLFENLIGSITSFFGMSEMTSDVEIDQREYEQDGLITDYKYRYVKTSCNLDNYKESECTCSPDEPNCTNLSHEDLIKVLKSDDKCEIDNKWLQYWDNFTLDLTGGKFTDECQLLRFVRGTIQAREDFYKSYNLKLDKGLIVSTILSSYDKQEKDLYDDDAANSTPTVDSVNHYDVLKDIAKEGIIKSNDVDQLIKYTILEDIYPYYIYDGSSCIMQSRVNYKFSLDKWKIYMRYGGVGANSYLGISDNGFSTAGYLGVLGNVILDEDITSFLENTIFDKSPQSLFNLTGSGWVYNRALNNAWNQSAEECRGEAFFTDRGMTGPMDLSLYTQAVDDVSSLEKVSFRKADVTYRKLLINRSATINFDYRAGFMYNKFTSFKKAIDEGHERYDERIIPKRIEQFIDEIIDRKSQINEILFYENDESDSLDSSDPEIAESKNYYWPIGSEETTDSNGIILAIGDPSSVKITSYYGMRTHPVDGTYKMHKGIDIAGKEGVTNVIASRSGTVVEINNNCTPGNKSCGSGYGNYIKVLHPDGKYTFYAHLHKDSIKVSVNDEVIQGQVIAKVGNTGNTTGPHLHFEVRTSSTTRVNPLNYVDPENPRPSASGTITGTSGSSNKQTVCLSLINSGISENATIALMINIQAESGFNPEENYRESDGEYSYGLFQWKGPEQKQQLIDFSEEKGLDYRSIEAQLNFVFYKMLHGGNRAKQAYDSLMDSANTAQTMATDFCLLYERPANKEEKCPKRTEKNYDSISTFVRNGCQG